MTGQRYAVIVVGGGLVGASLALALARSRVSVALVDERPIRAGGQPGFDDRPLALAQSSRRILTGLGVWSGLEPGATPIRHIHVSDRGHFGVTRLDAARVGVEAFGHVITARVLGHHLCEALGSDGPDQYCPVRVGEVRVVDDAVSVRALADDGTALHLRAALLVLADGGRSAIGRAPGAQAKVRSYGQTAIAGNVLPERDHRGTAYERFTEQGPLALLPMSHGRCGLIWTTGEAEAHSLQTRPEEEFFRALRRRFGGRLGEFLRVGARDLHPLSLVRVRRPVGTRVVMIGNAAQTLHPVAGQGFNLGLRDVAALAEVIVDAERAGEDCGAPRALERYRRWRRPDRDLVTFATDGLVRLFSNRFAPLVFARGLGLLALDTMPSLKREFARRAMGMSGKQTRLARGMAP